MKITGISTIEDIVNFCIENKKLCKKNKLVLEKKAAEIYLKNAGYELKNMDLVKIYYELKDISTNNGIYSTNKDYISARNKDILEDVSTYGSDYLINFLKLNGYKVESKPKTPKTPLSSPVKRADATTVKNIELVKTILRRSTAH